MKKYIVLILLTVGSVIGTFAYSNNLNKQIKEVETLSLKDTKIYLSVVAAGKIEEADKYDVIFSLPLKINKVNVDVGQVVKKGDVLFKIDIKESEKIRDSYNSSTLATENVFSSIEDQISGVTQNGSIPQDINKTIGDMKKDITLNTDEGETVTIPDKIVSKINGVVTDIQASTDSLTKAYVPLISISSLDNMIVRAYVNESSIGSIKIGQKVYIDGDGLAIGSYTGVVQKIYPTARQISTGSAVQTVVDVIIKIDNPDSVLKPGFNTDIRIITQEKDKAITVPFEAVLQDEDNHEYVYKILSGRVYKNYIRTGTEINDSFEVLKGLKATDKVILNPGEDLKNGEKVKVIKEESEKGEQK